MVLSKTLDEGLSAYAIGAKLRALRLKKKMGLVELGKHSGLSPALLSKLERGQLYPTLPTLLRIALVFSVGLEYFFAGAREKPVVAVVRRRQRLKFPERPGARENAYRFESLDYPARERRLNAFLAEFYPCEPDTLTFHQHDGAELIYVLKGTLSLHAGAEEHVLDAGDSVYFDAGQPHAYRRSGGRSCNAIIVTAP